MDKLTFAEVFQTTVLGLLDGVHTSLPAAVVDYEGHSSRVATVQPLVRLPTPSGPLLDVPPIFQVPLVFPSAAAGGLLFDVAPGDGVLVVFAEAGIGPWLKRSTGDPTDPGDAHRHALTNAIAIPGLWSRKTAPRPPSGDSSGVTAYAAGGAQMHLTDKVNIKNEITTLKAEMDAIWDAIMQLRVDLALNFQTLSAGISSDASFLISTVQAAVAAAALHQSAESLVSQAKLKLAELLTDA